MLEAPEDLAHVPRINYIRNFYEESISSIVEDALRKNLPTPEEETNK